MLDCGLNVNELILTDEDIFDKFEVTLTDFGIATPYLDKLTKRHLDKKIVKHFSGNMIFSSIHQLNFNSTGRRDDIISLFYMLIYLLKQGDMPGVKYDSDMDPNQQL